MRNKYLIASLFQFGFNEQLFWRLFDMIDLTNESLRLFRNDYYIHNIDFQKYYYCIKRYTRIPTTNLTDYELIYGKLQDWNISKITDNLIIHNVLLFYISVDLIDCFKKHFIDNINKLSNKEIISYLICLCLYEHLETAKWLYSIKHELFSINLWPSHISFILYRVCEKGNLEVANWIYLTTKENNINNNIFINSWSNDWTSIIEIIIKNGHLHLLNWLYNFNVNVFNYFELICIKGDINMFNWFISKYTTYHNHIYHIITTRLFYNVCSYGHLEIAKKLYKIRIINIDECYFRLACEKGYLELAKWLYELNGKLNILKYNNDALFSACQNGHLDIVKWLYSLNSKNVINNAEYALLKITKNNNTLLDEVKQLNMVKWLYFIKPNINIEFEYDTPFRNACLNQRLELVKFFVEKKPDKYSFTVDENQTISYSIKYISLPLSTLIWNEDDL